MEAFGLLILLVVVVACAGAGGVGFLLGYFVGRRSAAKQRQAGFPILPVESGRVGDPKSE
jgi:hypothetical protein